MTLDMSDLTNINKSKVPKMLLQIPYLGIVLNFKQNFLMKFFSSSWNKGTVVFYLKINLRAYTNFYQKANFLRN